MSHAVIGIGGTGARCVESFIHLCAAGLGPDNAFVLLIDPDSDNGNLKRTRELIQSYEKCHEAIHGKAPISVPAGGRSCRAFRTKLRYGKNNDQAHLVWSLGNDATAKRTLAKLFDYTNESPDKRLCELFYNQLELQLPWGQGFRGHASIANPALTDIRRWLDKQPFESLLSETKNCLSVGEHHTFLFASAFGATGAGGFPAVSQVLRNASLDPKERWPGSEKYRIGGALLLPYIFFESNVKKAVEEHAEARLFMMNTQAALLHYGRVWQAQCPFDSVYELGLAKPDQIDVKELGGDFDPGGPGQKNPTHLMEVLAALSALDFFSRPFPLSEGGIRSACKFYGTTGQSEKSVTWGDIPEAPYSLEKKAVKNVQRALTTYLTSTAIYDGLFYPTIESEGFERNRRLSTWNFEHFGADALTDAAATSSAKAVHTFITKFSYKWFWQWYRTSQYRKLELFNGEILRQLADGTATAEERAAGLSKILFQTTNLDESRSLDNAHSAVWDIMCNAKVAPMTTAFGRFWALLDASSAEYVERRYKFERTKNK